MRRIDRHVVGVLSWSSLLIAKELAGVSSSFCNFNRTRFKLSG